MKRIRRQTNCGAFTLIELLTVISIIAILIGIMSIGMNKAMMIAKNIRQKVEFKAMEVGLELFAKDFDGYPDSTVLTGTPGNPAGADAVCGAQRLAEVLMGRDSRGFEPATGWYPPQDELYKPVLGTTDTAIRDTLYDLSQDVSLKRRKSPYVEFKYSGVYTIDQLWQGNIVSSTIYTSASAVNRFRSPVITDTFNRYEITVSGANVKVGLPVLYFKADSSKRFRLTQAKAEVPANSLLSTEYRNWIYNFDDNLPLIQLPVLLDPTLPDKDYTDIDNDSVTENQAEVFYENITQTADKDRLFYKPYNTETFILISAGWDGVYGTKDDITNFNY
jgi:prepilin-type N-terminal cleavage/methylation domain-containing protein